LGVFGHSVALVEYNKLKARAARELIVMQSEGFIRKERGSKTTVAVRKAKSV
jgi:hypothetical protein